VSCGYVRGRYWDRTSDLFGVNELPRPSDLVVLAPSKRFGCTAGRGCLLPCFPVVTHFVTQVVVACRRDRLPAQPLTGQWRSQVRLSVGSRAGRPPVRPTRAGRTRSS
jgi:hypothetical protein